MTCAGEPALFPPCGHGAELPDQGAGGECFDEAEGDVGEYYEGVHWAVFGQQQDAGVQVGRLAGSSTHQWALG
jgi:hypothetical protein